MLGKRHRADYPGESGVMPTREEYLARCREAAIALLDAGDPVGGIALMISDLRKANEPLYDAVTLRLLLVDVLLPRHT